MATPKWYWWTLGAIFIVAIAAAIFTLYYVKQDRQETKRACEKVGGHLEIVDKIYAGKTTLNIYGCVK